MSHLQYYCTLDLTLVYLITCFVIFEIILLFHFYRFHYYLNPFLKMLMKAFVSKTQLIVQFIYLLIDGSTKEMGIKWLAYCILLHIDAAHCWTRVHKILFIQVGIKIQIGIKLSKLISIQTQIRPYRAAFFSQ